MAHATVVDDVHVVLLHALEEPAVMEIVGVKLTPPKFRPEIVTIGPKVRTPLAGT